MWQRRAKGSLCHCVRGVCRSRAFLRRSTWQCLVRCLELTARRSADLKAACVCTQCDNCRAGQHEEKILGRHDTIQPIVTRCHLLSSQVFRVWHEHMLNTDSEGGVLLGWTCSVQPLTLLWLQSHPSASSTGIGAPSAQPCAWELEGSGQPQPWASDTSLGTAWGQAGRWACRWTWPSRAVAAGDWPCCGVAGAEAGSPSSWNKVPGQGPSGLWVPSGPQHLLVQRLHMALTIPGCKKSSHKQSAGGSIGVCSHVVGGKGQEWGSVRWGCL